MISSSQWLLALALSGLGFAGTDGDAVEEILAEVEVESLVELNPVQMQSSVGHTLPPGPCDGGSWGYIMDPGLAIHVRTDGSDLTGDGSIEYPFASVARARMEANQRPHNQRHIGVGPGVFPTHVQFNNASLDTRILLMGCGPDSTVLQGSALAPVLDYAANATFGLRGVGLHGGRNGLTVRNNSSILVHAVDIEGSQRSGLRVRGAGTNVHLQDVHVADVSSPICGASVMAKDAKLLWYGGSLVRGQRVGVLADQADLYMEDVLVRNVEPAQDGTLGRGLHASGSSVVMSGGAFGDTRDAAISLFDPLGGHISRIIIDLVGAGLMDGQPSGGDGIVVRSQTGSGVVYLSENHVEGVARAGLLVEGIHAVVNDNTGSDTGLYPEYGHHFFWQGATTLSGSDAGSFYDLSANPLPLAANPTSCF